MRIGFDAKRAFLNESGLGNYSRGVIESLSKEYPDHDYFLFTPEKSELIPASVTERSRVITPRGLNKIFHAKAQTTQKRAAAKVSGGGYQPPLSM